MTLKINYFESFLKICELGSFSKAADKLNISQSAISQQIDRLEKFFNARLFKRSIKGASLTEEGMILLKRVKIILDNIQLVKTEINEKIKAIQGTLKISSSTIPGEHILPLYFTKFKKNHFDVKFQVEINDTTTSFNKLLNKEVDFSGVGSLLKYENLIDYIVLAEEELVLAVPPNHELSNKENVDPKEILKYPYISREVNSGTRLEGERILKNAGISIDQLQILCELTSTESILTAISEGMGISLISSIAASKTSAANLVRVLKLKTPVSPKRKLYFIRLKNQEKRNKLIDTFWDFIKNSHISIASIY
ncbi:MAG: LysR substrate-binding domain-containing protein [Candidatus Helarchaeota archaeon]